MPCAFTVWEDNTGQAHVTKMNTGLMEPMFGIMVAKVMGKTVSKEEKKMLSGIVMDN